MKAFVTAILLLALSPTAIWQRIWRDTNSHAAAQRGLSRYNEKRYEAAARAFSDAERIAPGTQNAFNEGTAQAAAGHPAQAAPLLQKAMADPRLRADALYNRGNSALKAKAYEYAIRDYSAVLRMRPGDMNAKRNLEIALSRLESMQRQQAGGKKPQPGGGGGNQPQQPQPSPQQKAGQKSQDADVEALLRSVQQQEQEEMQRMKKARAQPGRIGW